MDGGEVMETGTLEQIFSDPKKARTQDFLSVVLNH
jgi:ABC-type methionine transport system ATPase subunit